MRARLLVVYGLVAAIVIAAAGGLLQLLFGGHFFATALIVFCLAKIIFNLVNLRHFNGPDVGRINRWSVISTIVMILMATALAYDVWMDS